MAKTKEERSAYHRQWIAKKLAEDPDYYKKEYEKQKEHHKEWDQSQNGKKIHTISNWKRRGLIHHDYDALYEHYINTHQCNVCQYVFDESNRRCMDHDQVTKMFRQILCHRCNVHDNWKKYS